MMPEDKSLQTLHNNRIKCFIALHPVFKSLVWIVNI